MEIQIKQDNIILHENECKLFIIIYIILILLSYNKMLLLNM